MTPEYNYHNFLDCHPLRISNEDIFRMYETSDAFRIAVDSGDYIFRDGYFVLRQTAFLFSGPNNLEHTCDYCLSVKTTYSLPRSDQTILSFYVGNFSHKKKTLVHATKRGALDLPKEEFEDIISGEGDIEINFSTYLRHYMKKKQLTYEKLEDLTGIPERTIRRMKNDVNSRPSLEYVVAICVGMALRPSESENLLKAAGYFMRYTRKEKAYRYIIDAAYNEGVYACNRFLERMEIDPLTSL